MEISALASILTQARHDRGLSLREVERLTGIPNPSISQIETGYVTEPSFTTVVRLATAYKLPLKSLTKHIPATKKVVLNAST